MDTTGRILPGLAALVAVMALGATVALAAVTVGGPRGERLRGTNAADRIAGNGGADHIHGLRGPDRLHGGTGGDRVFGNRGRDRMAGGDGDDVQWGGRGDDRVFANAGVDVTHGGGGDDDLWALSRRDVTGPGDATGDTLHGGWGRDTLHTRDGEVDRVRCGPGRDVALLDTVDVIVDAGPRRPGGSCEYVVRAAPQPRDSAPEDAAE
jgi:Ca2+-binding RTX toxin-like protein